MASAWYQLRVFEVGHCLILHLFTCSCPFLCDIQELLYHGDVPILVLGLSKIHASVNPQGSSRIVNDQYWSIWIIILIYNNIQSSTCGWSRMKSDEVGWSLPLHSAAVGRNHHTEALSFRGRSCPEASGEDTSPIFSICLHVSLVTRVALKMFIDSPDSATTIVQLGKIASSRNRTSMWHRQHADPSFIHT